MMQENKLSINCGAACLIRDSQGMFDQVQALNLNCGILLISEELNARLAATQANINCDRTVVTGYQGEFLQISQNSPDGADFSGKFILIAGSLLVTEAGARALAGADGVLVSGTLYYPENCSGLLAGVIGEKRPYPADAFPIVGNRKLNRLLHETDALYIWVSGEVSALEEAALVQAKERGVSIRCGRLLMEEKTHAVYGDLFRTAEVELIPEGYVVTDSLHLTGAAADLYGTRLYVRGDLLLKRADADCLSRFEAIRVTGCATLPAVCAKAFRAVGSAEYYRVSDGDGYTINGWESFSHARLSGMVERGEKMDLDINGYALFDDDVTAEDMKAFSSIVCNGFMILPGEAQGALTGSRVEINGFTATPESCQQITGMTLEEARQQMSSGGNAINTDLYVML